MKKKRSGTIARKRRAAMAMAARSRIFDFNSFSSNFGKWNRFMFVGGPESAERHLSSQTNRFVRLQMGNGCCRKAARVCLTNLLVAERY